MTNLDALLAAHRAKAEAATPSPWTLGNGIKTVRDDTPSKRAICRTHDPKWRHGNDALEAADAAYIAANDPDTVLALLTVAEAADFTRRTAEGHEALWYALDALAEVLSR